MLPWRSHQGGGWEKQLCRVEVLMVAGTVQLLGSQSLSFTRVVLLHVLHDGEDDAEMVHRLDQLVHHADGLSARAQVDASFPLGQRESVGKCGARNDWMSGFSVCLSKLPFECSASHLS